MASISGGFTRVDFLIAQDDDWIDPLPQLLWKGEPLDLTNRTLELVIRPAFDHPLTIARLFNAAQRGIQIDDGPNGLASMACSQGTVQALPTGRWVKYCRVLDPAYTFG